MDKTDRTKLVRYISKFDHIDNVDLTLIIRFIDSLVGKPVAGVTFGDGEFVPIEDESIMQWIAEQLEEADGKEL